MVLSDLLFLLGGIAAGILLASLASTFYHRAKSRTASSILSAAKAEAARVQVDARHSAERLVADSARSEMRLRFFVIAIIKLTSTMLKIINVRNPILSKMTRTSSTVFTISTHCYLF